MSDTLDDELKEIFKNFLVVLKDNFKDTLKEAKVVKQVAKMEKIATKRIPHYEKIFKYNLDQFIEEDNAQMEEATLVKNALDKDLELNQSIIETCPEIIKKAMLLRKIRDESFRLKVKNEMQKQRKAALDELKHQLVDHSTVKELCKTVSTLRKNGAAMCTKSS